MAKRRQPTRRRGREPATAEPSRFQVLRNPWPPMEVLDEAAVATIHEASMRILEESGIDMWDGEARRILSQAGARVDEGARRVWLDRGLVMEAVSRAPGRFTLYARDPAKNLPVGGDHILFGAVGGPPFITDLDGGRRPSRLADLENLVRLIHLSDALTMGGGLLVEPLDLPQRTRHLHAVYADFTLTDKVSRASVMGREVTLDAIMLGALAHARPGDTEAEAVARVMARPVVAGVVSVNSPLRYDGPMLEGLLTLTRHGQVPIITPFIMAGAMSPASMASAVAQQNAETLAGVALCQIARPGNPVVYGGFASPLDMQSGATAFGAPEAAWALLAGAQMARHYRLPFRSSGALTSSQAPDAQAAYESLFSLWPAVMGHTHIITQAAGWLDGGLMASLEKFVIDLELIQMVSRFCERPTVSEESLALEMIHQVGPGGHHLETEHTMAHYRTAFYRPLLSTRMSFENWVQTGRQDAAARANQLWKEMLRRYERPALDEGVDEAMRAYVARRQAEIGA